MVSVVSSIVYGFLNNKFDLGEEHLLVAEIKLNKSDQPIIFIEPYQRPSMHLLPMVAKEIEEPLEVMRESQSPFNTATVRIRVIAFITNIL